MIGRGGGGGKGGEEKGEEKGESREVTFKIYPIKEKKKKGVLESCCSSYGNVNP